MGHLATDRSNLESIYQRPQRRPVPTFPRVTKTYDANLELHSYREQPPRLEKYSIILAGELVSNYLTIFLVQIADNLLHPLGASAQSAFSFRHLFI